MGQRAGMLKKRFPRAEGFADEAVGLVDSFEQGMQEEGEDVHARKQGA